jgi:4a-hydroxytetrahydrobiopterin dehydratase
MVAQTVETLHEKRCRPCESGIARFSHDEADAYLTMLQGWRLSHDGFRITKEWLVKDFQAGIDFFNRVAQVAEEENHHPELHLAGYRHVQIDLWTHAIGGLSENDFIMAAKIDRLPVELKEPGL